MSANRKLIIGVVALSLVVSKCWAADAAAASGSGTLDLAPLASDAGAPDERWQVRLQNETGTAVQGTVRIAGVPIQRPDRLGRVDWQVTGKDISGTVRSPGGGPAVGWFKGTVSGNELKGTFTTVMGQDGSWVWEGPIPKP